MSNYATATNLANSGGSVSSNGTSIQFDVVVSGAMSAGVVIYAGDDGPVVADKDTLGQQDKILGVTLTSTDASGGDIKVLSEGANTDASYSFVPGPIWLGNSGELTQVRPTTGLLVQIAIAVTATQIYVDIGFSLQLV